MTENRKHHQLIALLMLVGVILIALSLPRNSGQMGALLSHEVGKPWRNPTLIAPFDIPCEYDEATKQRITDSVNANFVHFYRLNTQLGNQKVVLLNQALTGESAVPASTRYQMVSALTQIYQEGIIDSDAYEKIASGTMQHVSIRDNSGTNATLMSTQKMHSVKQAYAQLDSLLAGSPYRDAVLKV